MSESHALRILELDATLSVVGGRAATELGAERVRLSRPRFDRAALEREHARVAAMRGMIAAEGGWASEPIPDLRAALTRLGVPGTSWTSAEFLAAVTLLVSSRRTRDGLRDERRPQIARAVLAELAARLVAQPDVERVIERTIAPDGTLRDDASPLLRRVRRELRGAQGELVKMLERMMSSLAAHQQVPDMSVTVRNGRYVIPVRREARTAIGGIVHDASSTGATLFVEPPAAVEAGNRIRELEAEEIRETERILRELTETIRPGQPALVDAIDALIELDSLYARARYADEYRCAPAELCDPVDGFVIRDGRHPLLLAQGRAVVPFDLEMLPDERTLLVSGPNTGGKTVLLMAVGLMSALAQCGVPAPVATGSRIPVYDAFFADVGDEQSIEASLSTFSAHLRNLAEILSEATRRSLVLVDELGSGTDPVEGAALGGAILEELTLRGTLTLATTHLGVLQQLATEVPGVVNASLQFDPVALAPTYRLIKGIPGRSYGLSIARRLGLPAPLIARAEERVPRGERDVAALLAELEAREKDLSERERLAAADTESVRDRGARIAERERNVGEREREIERAARRESRRYLLDARAEIERTIRELKGVESEAIDEAARAARRRVEELAASEGDALARVEAATTSSVAQAGAAGPLAVGDTVEITTFGDRAGRVVAVRDGDAVVAVGAMKMTVPVTAVRRSSRRLETPATVVPLRGDIPDVHAPSEIDVRGMRADEAGSVVMLALDAASRADLRHLRIIHGKGTGALRERVGEMLAKDPRVASYREGAWNEGGTGVTIVELS
jgi:DNA mismatch repair protein MutS2